MLSVVIPSRNDEFLQKTIDDLLAKAEGEMEIIVVLDGYWPDPPLKEDPRVILLHHGTPRENFGMRACINAGMAAAKGDYVMKIDEHCMVDKGFDVKLAADCEDNWVVIPRRWRLNAYDWRLSTEDDPPDKRPPIDYMYIAYPYERPYDIRCGLHGAEWKAKWWERKDVLIDDTMSWQGSCWFLKKKYWDELLEPLDDMNYGPFTHESQEIGFKVWLSGGRLVVNKKTWYAHHHKGKKGKGFGFSREQWRKLSEGNEKGRLFCIDYWINNRWPDRVHDFEWLLQKFWPVPTWPDDWKERIEVDKLKDYSLREINEKQD